jgi:hypothetical protein
MKFALVFKNGKILNFFLEETAKVYQKAYGGEIFLLLVVESKKEVINLTKIVENT